MRAATLGICLLAASAAYLLLGWIDMVTYLTDESRARTKRFEIIVNARRSFAIEDLVGQAPIFYCICGQRSGGCKSEAISLARKIGYSMSIHNFNRPLLSGFGIDGLKLFYQDRVVTVDAQAAVADEGYGFCGTDIRYRHQLQGHPDYFEIKGYNGTFIQ